MGRSRANGTKRNGRRRPSGAPRRAMSRLRIAYFAQAWDSGIRYGIGFDEVVAHLWNVRKRRGRLRLETVRHLDDLVHAIACTNGAGAAWSDLVDLYEGLLVRRCAQRVDEMDSILAVRRLFADLRRDAATSLGVYCGDRPLRAWLADRVLDRVNRNHCVWFSPSPAAAGGRVHRSGSEPLEEPVTLPFPS